MSFNGDGVSVLQERVVGMDGGKGCTTLRMHLIPLNYTLKMINMVNSTLCVFYNNKKIQRLKKQCQIIITTTVD